MSKFTIHQLLLAYVAADIIESYEQVGSIVRNGNSFSFSGQVYDLELGKVVTKEVPKMPFRITHLAINTAIHELWFIVEDSKIILCINYHSGMHNEALDVAKRLNTLMDTDDRIEVITYTNHFTEDIEAIVGVPLEDENSYAKAVFPNILSKEQKQASDKISWFDIKKGFSNL